MILHESILIIFINKIIPLCCIIFRFVIMVQSSRQLCEVWLRLYIDHLILGSQERQRQHWHAHLLEDLGICCHDVR
jgi:hypothetical protein